METLRDLWRFMARRKALWLAPILLALLALGGLRQDEQSSAVAPFIYTLF
jgi:hypothetical protein